IGFIVITNKYYYNKYKSTKKRLNSKTSKKEEALNIKELDNTLIKVKLLNLLLLRRLIKDNYIVNLEEKKYLNKFFNFKRPSFSSNILRELGIGYLDIEDKIFRAIKTISILGLSS
ncbi:uncharacterized protein LY79DRAFT_585561, partial [Colletotrichum navitas]